MPVTTNSGNATIAMKLEEAKRIDLCFERRPRVNVLSTNDSEANRMTTHAETIQSAMLPKCGKTLPHEKEKDNRLLLFSGDPQMIAIRTPLTCEDFNEQWTQHCE